MKNRDQRKNVPDGQVLCACIVGYAFDNEVIVKSTKSSTRVLIFNAMAMEVKR